MASQEMSREKIANTKAGKSTSIDENIISYPILFEVVPHQL
jgi:hypothetical protein